MFHISRDEDVLTRDGRSVAFTRKIIVVTCHVKREAARPSKHKLEKRSGRAQVDGSPQPWEGKRELAQATRDLAYREDLKFEFVFARIMFICSFKDELENVVGKRVQRSAGSPLASVLGVRVPSALKLLSQVLDAALQEHALRVELLNATCACLEIHHLRKRRTP